MQTCTMVTCSVKELCTKYEAGVMLSIPPPVMIIVGITWHVAGTTTAAAATTTTRKCWHTQRADQRDGSRRQADDDFGGWVKTTVLILWTLVDQSSLIFGTM